MFTDIMNGATPHYKTYIIIRLIGRRHQCHFLNTIVTDVKDNHQIVSLVRQVLDEPRCQI